MGAALQQLSRLVHDRGRLLPTGQSRLPVSRGTDKLDIFAADVNGNILTSAWEPDLPQWRTWRQVAGGTTIPGAHVTAVSRSTDKLDMGAPVHAVSRSTDKLDIFAVGSNFSILTSAWEPGFTQ